MSIYQQYYENTEFIDKFKEDKSVGIDVIIPCYHTNELWKANLHSIYKEIPVSRLLISDGGCIDDSIEVVSKFPRVEVYDHRDSKTLGWCIAQLIKNVNSEHFIYLHSDVYLPEGWYTSMIKHKDKYDWYGCPMQITVMVDYHFDMPGRPYAGSQIGKKEAFTEGLNNIDDDFIYRQEDFVFNKIVEDAGYKTGKVDGVHHYHQVMYRKTKGFDINVENVIVNTKNTDTEITKASQSQIRGIVKYLDPIERYVINDFMEHAKNMLNNKSITYRDFRNWIKETNPKWLKLFNLSFYIKLKIKNLLKTILKSVKSKS